MICYAMLLPTYLIRLLLSLLLSVAVLGIDHNL